MVAAGLLTAAVRRGVGRGSPPHAASAILITRRSLGDTVRGPQVTDLAANYRLACQFFTKPSISYPQFKQQCVSLRLFAFGAVTLGCVAGLIIDPPKSSWWTTYGPGGWFTYIKDSFSPPKSPPLFLTKKSDSTSEVAGVVAGYMNKQQSKESGGLLGSKPKAAAAKEAPKKVEAPPKEVKQAPAKEVQKAPPAPAAAAVVETSAKEDCSKCAVLAEGAAKHTAFVFIKPHAVTDKVKYLMNLKFRCSGIKVLSEGSIAAEKIDKDQLIDTHYGAIAAKAVKVKPDALTVQPKAQEAFEKAFGMTWADAVKSGKVYNAMDAAKKLGVSTKELGAKWGKIEKGNLLKFGGGFYCGKMEDIWVINAFYMNMRDKFTTPGTSIFYYQVEWDPKELSWGAFREEILGGTDPKTAFIDSARHLIFSNWEQLGLKACPNTGDNGVHASASPLEALSERCNWLGETLEQDYFGKAMLASGVPLGMLKAWCDDPAVNFEGKKQSLFDLLEDLDAGDCLKKSALIAEANR